MSNCDLVTKHKTRKIYETVTLEVGYTIQTGNVITGDWWRNIAKVSILGRSCITLGDTGVFPDSHKSGVIVK